MKNSFTLSTEECTCFRNDSAEVPLMAECFISFRIELWMGKKPGAEKELCSETGGKGVQRGTGAERAPQEWLWAAGG